MIKRPLVWILGAYLVGMYQAWQSGSVFIEVLGGFLLYLLLYLLMFRIRNKWINRKDWFLWSLPIFLVLGFLAMRGQMKLPELYQEFEQETPCVITGNITMIVEKQCGKALYITNNVVSLTRGDPYLCENIIVFSSDQQNYLVGNQITVQGTLQKFSKASNPGQFNEQLYYQIENIDFKMEAKQIIITNAEFSTYQVYLGRFKSKLIEVYSTILEDKESGALIAMLLGEKYLLDEEIKQLYQENGISHVLAISGLHVSLIGLFVFGLLKKCKLPITLATFLSIFFIYSYGVLTNFSVSTNRAVVMMVIMLLSTLFGKTYDMLSAISLSALIILIQNPLQIMSAGFLLSFGAVLGIAVLLPCLQLLFPTKNSLRSSILLSISAQMATTPFVLYFYYQFPVYSILTNLLILPFVTVLTLTSILAGIAGAIYMPVGIFLIGGANYILKFYEGVCRVGSKVPGNLITIGRPTLLQLILYAFLLAIFVWATRKYNKKYLLVLFLLAFVVLLIPQRNVGLEITMIDVGQGDSIFMESESGTTYLIDGGSADVKNVGTYRLKPFLMSQGVGTIDYVMVSHSDYDHISGVKELIEKGQIKIRNLVLPNIIGKDDAYMELEELAKGKGINLSYIQTGDTINDGDIKMFCLHPSADYVAESSNASSTVLSITYGEFDMLLTGDLEKVGEMLLIKRLHSPNFWLEYGISPSVDYDVLKVAHHGSKNSTSHSLLQLISPEISLISCGKNNYYGHPHKELLERLYQVDSNIVITYDSGAITIKTDGKMVEIEEYNKQ